MPRWYALCNGAGIRACALCKRHVSNNGTAQHEPQQGFVTPELSGDHCNRFIECPPYQRAAITPTDSR